MKPIVDGLEQQYAEQFVFKRVNADIDDGPAVVQEYRILGHPTLMIFDAQGREVERLIGPQPEAKIRGILDKILQ